METKLNIAEILKDKPVNIKLYSPTYGGCNLIVPEDMIITDMLGENRCFYEDGKISKAGECMLFPSKEMRDWSKFAWKKGDVLVSKGRRILHVIFEGFNDDTYTTFKGKHYICDYLNREDYDEEYYNDYQKEVNERTIEFEKDNVNKAQIYINIIEKRLGGKLNRETLEIEANINVGDVVSDDVLYGICTKVDKSNVYCDFGCDSSKYNAPITKLCLKKENINVIMLRNKEAWYKEIEKRHHISIDRNTWKVQPEFKDGDIVLVESHMLGINTSSMIAIFRKAKEIDKYKFSPALCKSNEHYTYLREDPVVLSPSHIKTFRPATDSEKLQLFDALAKESKAWDAEKKEVIDLKPRVELKPFDKVLCRNSKDDTWEADFFARLTRKEIDYTQSGKYLCVGDLWMYCIPYEGNEHLLGTTKEVED